MLAVLRPDGRGLSCVLLLVMALPGVLSAADAKPSPASAMLGSRAERVEDELAALMQQRSRSPKPADALRDVQIDLRVTADWMLRKSAESSSPDVQSCGYLRAESLLSAADLLSQRFRTSHPAQPQLDAMGKLHQMTYRLGELKTVAQMDQSCKAAGELLIAAGGSLGNPGEGLPVMRPMEIERPDEQSSEPPSIAELTAEARQASVLPALRLQLLALAEETAAASKDPNRQDDAAALYGVLVRALDMTAGLQGGLVDPQTRGSVEPQLAGGIVLFLDPRTRPAGKERIDRLSSFGRMLQHVRSLEVPANLRDRLAPALAWAQRHVDDGPRVVQTVGQYLDVCRRYDARKPEPALGDAQRKVAADLERQFAAQRQGFLSDAAELGDGGGMMAVQPGQLRSHLAVMEQSFEQIALIDAMPSALQAVNAFKPRPTGALDRRALVAVNAIGGIVPSPTPAEATRFLRELQTLGQIARQIPAAADVPPEVNRLYARGKLAEFNARRAQMLSDVASQAAGGKDPDPARLARLAAAQELIDAVREGGSIEASLKNADAPNRWVDWRLHPRTLDAALAPYRKATGAAVESFAGGDAGAIDLWRPLRRRAEPLLVLARELGTYEEQCNDFPAGWTGEVARLLTPMDRQPFAAERHASLLLAAWEQASTDKDDAAGASDVIDSLGAELRKDLRLEK